MRTAVPSASSPPRGRVTWKEPSSPWGRPTRPAASHSTGFRAPSRATSIDDVDEHAAVLLDRRGLHDRPQGVGGAPASPDDLAVVVLGDRELEDDGAVVLLELLNRD